MTGSTAGAGLIIGALEDNDDSDDTATGICDWVLSFRDKPKLNSLVFKPAATTSAPLRALTGARAKTGTGEDADVAATEFCKLTVASITEFKPELNNLPFTERRVCQSDLNVCLQPQKIRSKGTA